MKKLKAALLAAVLIAAAVFSAGCADKKQMQARLDALTKTPVSEADMIPDICQSPDGKYEIGLCISGTLLKDRGFNEFCLNGVKLFAKENNKTYKYYVPPQQATDDDCLNCINAAAMNGAKVIVIVGFQYAGSLQKAAEKYPDIKFVFIDGSLKGVGNVVSICFKENEGGYLAGYSAVKDGYTKLGFVGGGGGSNDACNRYGRGFVCGAEAAAKEMGTNIEINYTYQYATTFTSSPELQALSNAWYTNGTEAIFVAAGAAQDCVAASASANDAWVITCDSDASARSKAVLTSSLKRTDIATQEVLKRCYSEEWDRISGGLLTFGLDMNCIGLPTDNWRFSKFTVEEYEDLIQRFKNGEIEVDSDHNNNRSTEWIKFRYM